jgi:hypothetical protein
MNSEPGKSFRRKAQAKTKLTVSAAADGEEALKAEFRRRIERDMLEGLFHPIKPPVSINKQVVTGEDIDAFVLAVNHARRTAKDELAFLHLVHKKTLAADVRFFAVCAAAMDAVEKERAGWNDTDGHRMAALQAKLELEKNLGTLPTQKAVKEHAFDILMRCRWLTFSPREPRDKRWSKILDSVGLDYLKPGVKGKTGK